MYFAWTDSQIALKAELNFFKSMNGTNWYTNPEPMHGLHWTDAQTAKLIKAELWLSNT